MRQVQRGFTLIELIVVIVILGILAASALPRFIDLQIQARQAKLQAAIGAVRAASSLYHAQCLAGTTAIPVVACPVNNAGTNAVLMEGLAIDGRAQYPSSTAAGIVAAAGLRAATAVGIAAARAAYTAAPGNFDYIVAVQAAAGAAGVATIEVPSPTAGSCQFTYTPAVAAGTVVTAPVVTVTSSTCI